MLPLRILLCAAALAGLVRAAGHDTVLDRYVAAPDPSYRYTLVNTLPGPGLTIYQLDLVSQTWLTPADVDRTEWHHWLTIFKPARVNTSTAMLFIDGGSNSATPTQPDPSITALAALAGAVVVGLGQVPNEPLTFAGETQGRTEDALIAYTWSKYLTTGDDRWPARLPMTKAAVRAMDAATDFLAKLPGGAMTIKNFAVTGASKRGWATWTTAAVDPRVIAIAPIVIDTLNVEDCFVHEWQAYGFWEPAAQDYIDAGIFSWLGTVQMAGLLGIEDPFVYRKRFIMPKYMIYSTGDQFFLPDDSQFYYGSLPGEKYLRYVPNTDHTMQSLGAIEGLLAWFQAVTADAPRPRFYWRTDRANGALRVRALDQPQQVLLWQASNPAARDFRLATIGPAWTSTPVSGQNGAYDVAIPAPAKGYTAFFLELTFPGSLVFTTDIVVTPNTYPYPPPPGAAAPPSRR